MAWELVVAPAGVDLIKLGLSRVRFFDSNRPSTVARTQVVLLRSFAQDRCIDSSDDDQGGKSYLLFSEKALIVMVLAKEEAVEIARLS